MIILRTPLLHRTLLPLPYHLLTSCLFFQWGLGHTRWHLTILMFHLLPSASLVEPAFAFTSAWRMLLTAPGSCLQIIVRIVIVVMLASTPLRSFLVEFRIHLGHPGWREHLDLAQLHSSLINRVVYLLVVELLYLCSHSQTRYPVQFQNKRSIIVTV